MSNSRLTRRVAILLALFLYTMAIPILVLVYDVIEPARQLYPASLQASLQKHAMAHLTPTASMTPLGEEIAAGALSLSAVLIVAGVLLRIRNRVR